MKNLKQKQWPEYKSFELKDDGLHLETREGNQYINTLIEFEHIGSKEIIVNQKPNPIAIVAFISVVFNVLFLLIYLGPIVNNPTMLSGIGMGFTAGISIWAISVFKSSKQKILQGGHNIGFFYNKKYKTRVDQFITELNAKKKMYLRGKFMSIDKHTPDHQLKSRYLWLRDTDVITEYELDELMLELENRRLINGNE